MKQQNKFLKASILKAFSSFLIPLLVMLILFAVQGIYPFHTSDGTSYNILTLDLNNQYISFFSYWKEVFKGNADFTYTFSKTLGGDMVGLSAYYLMSPLNFILLFFSTAQIPFAIIVFANLK